MTTVTEALRAQFEKLLSDSGRACLYEGDGQYAYPHDFAWLCYQAGHAAAKAVVRVRGSACERCGWDKARCDVHHRVARYDGGLNTIRNGEVICPNCHRVAHEQSGGGEA